MASPQRNEWIAFGRHLNSYVRKSVRMIAGERMDCLDIANTGVDPDHQRKGIYKRYLAMTEKVGRERCLVLFHENVLNPDLLAFLKSRDYLDVPGSNPPSVYKII